ncbi:MAG TPA: winged helix DNA-binding domain-containing protein [Amycolatopsis sp.]|uniref:winged helix DNA-binding domain-containing protein n=1 Tax=Amycolatopsis sp. TaxID=37632 RepID=UPI002B4A2213|nr:winged helix DNA-binding domain-containing protein [Amycolatopsis sp.]HKS47356.1 winged helix DNA-binding domain-containing protein [Amycolatopsis sp.]
MSVEVLGPRALNRALLARQLLLRRQRLPALDAVANLVGLQAQAPFPPYYGLWSRLDGFSPDELARCLLDRSVVRIVLMRGTVHLVTADDCRWLRPLVQPIMDRDLGTNTTHAKELVGLDLFRVAFEARALLAEQPMTAAQLGKRLAQRWPDRKPASLAHAARGLLPLVQIPPRAVWGKSGRPTFATAEDWLGAPLDTKATLENLVLRYLAAFGPATVNDIQAWSGLTRLGEVVGRLRGRLRVFATERGRELFDVPEAPRPDPETPVPLRLVAEFDNLILSHADRTRVISEEARKRVFAVPNGVFPGTVLMDGFVQGTWKIVRRRGEAALEVRAFRRYPEKATAALESEGARLLRFAALGDTHDIRLVHV